MVLKLCFQPYIGIDFAFLPFFGGRKGSSGWVPAPIFKWWYIDSFLRHFWDLFLKGLPINFAFFALLFRFFGVFFFGLTVFFVVLPVLPWLGHILWRIWDTFGVKVWYFGFFSTINFAFLPFYFAFLGVFFGLTVFFVVLPVLPWLGYILWRIWDTFGIKVRYFGFFSTINFAFLADYFTFFWGFGG